MVDDRLGDSGPWRSWIGRKTEVLPCEDKINWPQIKQFCAAVGDGNPIYWDEDEAKKRFDSLISPPAMTMVWFMPLPWRPGGARELPMLALEVPVPGDTFINGSTDTEFLRPMRVGDRLSFQEEIAEISPEKTTRVGAGRFVTSTITYRNQGGEIVSRQNNTLFRYFARTAGGGPE